MDTSQEQNANIVGDALKAQRFQMLEDIAKELSGEVVFPTYFDAIVRIRKELQNPDLSILRVANIVGTEPLIVSKLMRLANSSLYSPGGPRVRDIRTAVSLIGVELVRTTALGIAMNQLLKAKEIVPFGELTHALWEHSLKTAAACRVLARSYTKINPDEAFLAGLVHDLGAFYMLYRAAQYPELMTRADTVKYLIAQWHESIGATLLTALGMPEEIVCATIDHDQPRTIPQTVKTLIDVVYLGNILAGTHFEWRYQDIDPEAGQPGLVRQRFSDLLPQIEACSLEIKNIFS